MTLRPAHPASGRRSTAGRATDLYRGGSMHGYDKSSKWLIQHFADSILCLAGVRGILSWRPLRADFVQPRRHPDGFVEVQRLGQAKPDLYVLEVATYPEASVAHQLLADAAMVYLDRKVLPEVVVLFLHRGGNVGHGSKTPVFG
jgi:hypothetical protein